MKLARRKRIPELHEVQQAGMYAMRMSMTLSLDLLREQRRDSTQTSRLC